VTGDRSYFCTRKNFFSLEFHQTLHEYTVIETTDDRIMASLGEIKYRNPVSIIMDSGVLG
jgi:hypothetical protein